MASTINPNNIDGAYPVAGQDNDSQGFRDNFTNTKTNFEYAATEITDLQNKVILKAALTGTTLDNNMAGSLLSNAQLQNMSETKVALGTVSGSQTIDYSAGPYYTLTTAGSISLVFTNFPTAGTVGRCRLQITVSSIAHTLTLPVAVSVGTSNIQGLSSNIITFSQTGTFEFEFETSDAGATVSVFDLSRNLDPINLPSSEDLGDTAAVSLAVTTSYFSTSYSGNSSGQRRRTCDSSISYPRHSARYGDASCYCPTSHSRYCASHSTSHRKCFGIYCS